MKFMPAKVIIVWVLLLKTAVAGEPPKIDRLSPPGGQRGTSVETTLVGKTGDGDLKMWTLQDQLEFTAVPEKPTAITIAIPADATPGIHWVRFHNQHGASQLTPFVVGLIPELAEAEPNNSASNAQTIQPPSVTINGVLDKSQDVDVYAVTLQAEQTVVASVLANRVLGSPMDAVLQILDANGVVLTQVDDDHALDPQIAFTAPAEGRYFVRMFAFPSAPNSTIRLANAATYVYRLTLTTEGFVDFTIPAAVDGTSETPVVLHGWNLPGNERQVVVSPQRPESFLVTDQLASYLQVPRSATLCLTDKPVDVPLEFPCSVSGIIADPQEVDAFRFAGTKGQKLNFSVVARAMYSALDPVLRIRNEAGSVIKESDDVSRDNQDCEEQVTLPADGVYSVEVTDRYDSGSRRHFYVLTCTTSSPAISAALSVTSVTVQSDKPVEIPVTLNRTNGFSAAVTLSAVGLPEGVTCEAVISEPTGDSAKKVTLKIQQSANAPAYSGLVSIVGSSEQSVIRATSQIPNSSDTVDSIWLTVIPASTEADGKADANKN